MSTQQDGVYSIFGMVLWLIWVIVAVGIVGGTLYLFVVGSVFFNTGDAEPIVAYKSIYKDRVSLHGAVNVPECARLVTSLKEGGSAQREIHFSYNAACRCAQQDCAVRPETFLVAFGGAADSQVHIFVNHIKQQVIIK